MGIDEKRNKQQTENVFMFDYCFSEEIIKQF